MDNTHTPEGTAEDPAGPPHAARRASVRARIAPSAVGLLTELFNASIQDTAAEILQNARRAGATRVDVELTPETDAEQKLTRAVFSDDGCGIADPAVVLSFGESAWADERAMAERPAGMGFFAAAQRGRHTTIESRPAGTHRETGLAAWGWSSQLDDAHFRGDVETPITWTDFDEPQKPGTRVTIVLRGSVANTRHLIAEAAAFCGVHVHVDGNDIDGTRDFLLNHIDANKLVGIETDGNLRIGVERVKLPRRPGPFPTHRGCTTLNFHGRSIADKGVPTVHVRPGSADAEYGAVYRADIDIIEPRDIRLTLPARHRLIHDEARERLIERAHLAIYRQIAASKTPVVLSHDDAQRSRAAGIAIREAEGAVGRWAPRCLDPQAWDEISDPGEPVPASRSPILMPGGMAPIHEMSLADGLDSEGDLTPLGREDEGLRGFAWYDALPRVTGATIVATAADGREATWALDIETDGRTGDAAPTHRDRLENAKLPDYPIKLRMDLDITHADGRVETKPVPIRFAVRRHNGWTADEVDVIGPEGPGEEDLEPMAAMMRAGLLAVDGSDEYENCAELWEDDIRPVLREALNIRKPKRSTRTLDHLHDEMRRLIDRDGTYTIRVTRDETGVTMETLEAPPPIEQAD